MTQISRLKTKKHGIIGQLIRILILSNQLVHLAVESLTDAYKSRAKTVALKYSGDSIEPF